MEVDNNDWKVINRALDSWQQEGKLTPELEAELERLLNYPKTDPHKSEIPYRE